MVLEENSDKEDKQSNKVVYQCTQCKYQTDKKNTLTEHMNEVHSPKIKLGTFKCDQCDYLGVKEDSLEQHKRTKYVNKKTNPGHIFVIMKLCVQPNYKYINYKRSKQFHNITNNILNITK